MKRSEATSWQLERRMKRSEVTSWQSERRMKRSEATSWQSSQLTQLACFALRSLSHDIIAILDQTDFKTIRCFDALTGRPLGSGAEIKHDQEITKIALSQFGTSSMDRRLAFIDSNKVRKAASVVSCIMR
jgi:hypothetical protein